jgi:hypothetical protein
MWRARAIILIWVLIGICVGVTSLMYLLFVLGMLWAALQSAGKMSPGLVLWMPLYFLWGTPVIAPCAGFAALYLYRSPRFSYLAILPTLLLVASAIVSTSSLWWHL